MQQGRIAEAVFQRIDARGGGGLHGRGVGIMKPPQRHVGGGRQRDEPIVGTVVLRLLPRADPAVVLPRIDNQDRKSVVQGKRVSVRVDIGGRSIIKKITKLIVLQTMYNYKTQHIDYL